MKNVTIILINTDIESEFMTRKFKNAFTLAEVLITLTIVGVVASLTVPTLVANTQAHELKAAYNNAYATLANAEKTFQSEYGISYSRCAATYGNKCREDWAKLFTSSTEVDVSTNASAVAGTSKQLYQIRNFKGGNTSQHCDASNRMLIKNQIIYSFDDNPAAGYNGPRMCVDINGIKKPNIVGVDIFNFFFLRAGGLVPEGTEDPYSKTYDKMDSSQKIGFAWGAQTQKANGINTCSSSNPIACSYYAAQNTSPTGKGTYWEDFIGKRMYVKY
ncbi:MAG: type II secretion system GspH family protein [bacterium]|nr:type II secretion system GspH family protein [bacterium]